jgi:succinate dehydrogenase/fumarate reductase flavoprotein subunit
MWEKVGIVRDGENLNQAITAVRALQERAERMSVSGHRVFNLGWQQALDLRNLLLASELIAHSAISREDSRGAHHRSDFPQTDQTNWLRNIYVSRNGSGMKSWTKPVELVRLRP